MAELLLATRNAHKVKELQELLKETGLRVLYAADFPEIEEPVEDGATFQDNADKKALYYARATGLLALADDSGLSVDALNGRPGVHSSRYAENDRARIAKLLDEMKAVPEAARSARFVCAMTLADPSTVVRRTTGTLEGRIGHSPAGENGFGYDPVFLVGDGVQTLAELSADEKNAISHRGQALRQMVQALLEYNTSGPLT